MLLFHPPNELNYRIAVDIKIIRQHRLFKNDTKKNGNGFFVDYK